MSLAVTLAAVLSFPTIAARAEELCLVPGGDGAVSVDCNLDPNAYPLGWEGFTTGDVPCANWPDTGLPYCRVLPDCPAYEFGWTISASDTDPRMTAAAIGGVQSLYLWLLCVSCLSPTDGLSAVAFDFGGTIEVLSFTPANGFLNAGTDTEILMAAVGCPRGPIVAAEILVNLPPVSVDAASWGALKARYRR